MSVFFDFIVDQVVKQDGELARLKRERAELLAALKESLRLPNLLVRSYEDVEGCHVSAKTAAQFDERYRALRRQIEAVIAKMETV